MKSEIEGNEKNDIFSFDLVNKQENQLTKTPTSADIIMEESPDGKSLLFKSDRTNSTDNLYLMNLQDKSIKQLTNHSKPIDPFSFAIWSPDGKFIAYSFNESANSKNMDIWIYNLDKNESEKVVSLQGGSKEQPMYWTKHGNLIFISDETGYNKIYTYEIDSKTTKSFGKELVDEMFGCYIEKSQKIIATRAKGVHTQLVLILQERNFYISQRELY